MEHLRQLINQHAQIALTPQEYQHITRYYRQGRKLKRHIAGADYWDRMPQHRVAQCPICTAVYVAYLDTYNLRGWVSDTIGESVFMPQRQEIGCSHFVGTQIFINLHGLVPTEVGWYFSNNNSEVPFVMPIFVPDDIESYVVMHAVSVCRVEQDEFVPRYTVFMLTYYSSNPSELIKRRLKEMSDFGGDDPEFRDELMYTWRHIKATSDAWELSGWVTRSKLLWLDLTKSDLPLKAKPVKDFPYGDIEGFRRSYVYRNGVLIKGN
jgi:hypothetical protein